MTRFYNKKCPICRSPFNDESDIVVCPICGTPHHRSCYMGRGSCGVSEYHDKGFVWKGSLPDEPEVKEPETETKLTEEDADGMDSLGIKNLLKAMAEEDEDSDGDPIRQPITGLKRLASEEVRGADGVSGKELSLFVGKSVIHYAQAFEIFRLEGGGLKLCLNICAGLFSPLFQFYRRMDGLGILAAALSLLTSLPSLLVAGGYVNYYALEPVLAPIGVICNIVSFAVTVGLCLFNDFLYYRFTVRSIKRIRSRYDDGKAEGYYEALRAAGNPSWLRAVIGCLAIMLIISLITVIPRSII